ncbi:putative receptor-like protein kinase [Cinnamomum micranthum f. kanehirae]|uniref:Putative receptor-like protein kinase n=1 Tax=Cinnamomum micranthum f. kanehirae TaxID=337451 RepID=A0A443PBZ7_9MAGN|nr:putative receptor-like protein kinase [Cinnamomum micranthum f. kanehirae]
MVAPSSSTRRPHHHHLLFLSRSRPSLSLHLATPCADPSQRLPPTPISLLFISLTPADRCPFFLHSQTAPPSPATQSPIISPSSPSMRRTHPIHRQRQPGFHPLKKFAHCSIEALGACSLLFLRSMRAIRQDQWLTLHVTTMAFLYWQLVAWQSIQSRSEVIIESVSVREATSQPTAPQAKEEVQQKLPVGEKGHLQWKTSEAFVAENYVMPFGPPACNPFLGGMQMGVYGDIMHYSIPMPPYMGYISGVFYHQDPYGVGGYGYTISAVSQSQRPAPKIPEVILSKSHLKEVALAFHRKLHVFITILYDIARGEDLKHFLLAWRLCCDGKVMELIDPILIDSCPMDEVLRFVHIGLLCIQEDATDRPTMASVVVMLGSTFVTLPHPTEPPLYVGKREAASEQSSSNPKTFSNNEVTISEVGPQ